jgi:putative zinc finger/helix-turn-helix YgiT family protein
VEEEAMKCVNCGSALKSTTGTHRYTESGLSNVTLVNVELRACPACGENEVVIPKVETLNRMIARGLIRNQSPLQPEAVKFLRKWLGLSSTDFALYMGVRPETVSRWESPDGKYPLSQTADRLLRLLVANQDPVEKYPVDLFKTQPRVRRDPIKLRAPDWKKEAAS